ncbi:hypothetical protein J1605_010229 [Eschrichtius robustus]|uniref:protein-tyrosine-phosphatase n=1 Tax=Eschrichtius robustus TaxID=9764 RepID=A0AB34GUT4_ESCRO|nr:hypothetical protein J1605_010229 [Eschrichtius robustus]
MHAACTPLHGAGVPALVGTRREMSMGPKSLRVAGAGRGVLRAALTWIAPDLEPDRAPACAAPEPRTLLEQIAQKDWEGLQTRSSLNVASGVSPAGPDGALDTEPQGCSLGQCSLRISGKKVSIAIISGPTAPPSGKCRYNQPQLPNSSPPSGGYERFSSEYPEFCSKTKALAAIPPSVPPSTAESLDLGCSSCGTPLHDQGGPVEILPFLYLGSAYHAARRDMLDALGITALLNVSSDCPNHFEGHYQYKCIPVEDNHKADISSWFMEAIEYIGRLQPPCGKDGDPGAANGTPLSAPDAVKDCRGRVLVHCQAGISRSATICLAYLMMKKRVRLEEAFEFVKQRRSIISPNFSFMGQLLQFESQVLATSCAVEAASPSGPLRERGKATPTPTSQFVFSFPVSVGGHPAPSSLPYLHSPITTSPSC